MASPQIHVTATPAPNSQISIDWKDVRPSLFFIDRHNFDDWKKMTDPVFKVDKDLLFENLEKTSHFLEKFQS